VTCFALLTTLCEIWLSSNYSQHCSTPSAFVVANPHNSACCMSSKVQPAINTTYNMFHTWSMPPSWSSWLAFQHGCRALMCADSTNGLHAVLSLTKLSSLSMADASAQGNHICVGYSLPCLYAITYTNKPWQMNEPALFWKSPVRHSMYLCMQVCMYLCWCIRTHALASSLKKTWSHQRNKASCMFFYHFCSHGCESTSQKSGVQLRDIKALDMYP
jgi:hypothetical protein